MSDHPTHLHEGCGYSGLCSGTNWLCTKCGVNGSCSYYADRIAELEAEVSDLAGEVGTWRGQLSPADIGMVLLPEFERVDK